MVRYALWAGDDASSNPAYLIRYQGGGRGIGCEGGGRWVLPYLVDIIRGSGIVGPTMQQGLP